MNTFNRSALIRQRRSKRIWHAMIMLIAISSSCQMNAQSATPGAAFSNNAAIAGMHAVDKTNACESTTVPVPRLDKPFWMERHLKVLKEIQHQRVDLVFLGDSIMNNFEKKGPLPQENYWPIWLEFYGNRHALNLGFSGDRTENVLWRLENGELNGLSPKVIVMMIGTNNTHQECSKWYDVLAGELAIIDQLHERAPEAKILLLGIFPSAVSQRKSEEDRRVNKALSLLYVNSNYVTYRDISGVFEKDGKVDTSLYYDPRPNGRAAHELHPSSTSQRKWVEAIEPTLSQMLNEHEGMR